MGIKAGPGRNGYIDNVFFFLTFACALVMYVVKIPNVKFQPNRGPVCGEITKKFKLLLTENARTFAVHFEKSQVNTETD